MKTLFDLLVRFVFVTLVLVGGIALIYLALVVGASIIHALHFIVYR